MVRFVAVIPDRDLAASLAAVNVTASSLKKKICLQFVDGADFSLWVLLFFMHIKNAWTLIKWQKNKMTEKKKKKKKKKRRKLKCHRGYDLKVGSCEIEQTLTTQVFNLAVIITRWGRRTGGARSRAVCVWEAQGGGGRGRRMFKGQMTRLVRKEAWMNEDETERGSCEHRKEALKVRKWKCKMIKEKKKHLPK